MLDAGEFRTSEWFYPATSRFCEPQEEETRLGECLGSNLTPPDATKQSSGKRQRKAIRPDSSFASWRNSAP